METSQLIDLINLDKLDKANEMFSDLMAQKKEEALESERVNIAQNFLNNNSEEISSEE